MGINDWGQDSYWGLGRWSTKTTPQSKKDGLVKNILYIRSLDTSGWLLIKLEPNGGNVSVPEYTKVILQKEANGRVYFLVKEGQYANRTASLKKVNADKCLVRANRGKGSVISVRSCIHKHISLNC